MRPFPPLIQNIRLEDLHDPIEYPYKFFADKRNPFFEFESDSEKAAIFSKLVSKLYEFAFDCTISFGWELENEKIKSFKDSLYSKRDEIIKLVTQLIPKEAKKQVAHPYIRACEYFSPWLIDVVNAISLTLNKIYDNVKNNKSWRSQNTDWKRKKAVEIFLQEELEFLYEMFCYLMQRININHSKTKEELFELIHKTVLKQKYYSAFPYTALRIISLLADCSYDSLQELYYSKKSTKKNQKKFNK